MEKQTRLQSITQRELEMRRAAESVECRPMKKQATDATMAALREVGRPNLKRKTLHAVKVSSDGEMEASTKRQKVGDTESYFYALPDADAGFEPIEDPRNVSRALRVARNNYSDSDDDIEDFLVSLRLDDDSNWVSTARSNKAEDLTPVDELAHEHGSPHRLPPPEVAKRKKAINRDRLAFDHSVMGPWGMILEIFGTARAARPFHMARRKEHLSLTGFTRSSKLYHDLAYSKVGITGKYPHIASGPINKIIQAQGKFVLCAAVSAGSADYSEDEDELPPPPENKSGSLVVYDRGRVNIVRGHCRNRMTSHGLVKKYYSVNDVAFNPLNSQQFLSSGHDFTVQLWEIPEDNGEDMSLLRPRMFRSINFDDVTHDLVYKPDTSMLAVACRDGSVYLYSSRDLFEATMYAPVAIARVRVVHGKAQQAAGATVWGIDPSSHLLFTSSEPHEPTNDHGYHRAYDVVRGTTALDFDATEAGEALAISPDGTTLVLLTTGPGDSHPVRLYDVRRKSKHAYVTEHLLPFRTRSLPNVNAVQGECQEVNSASFSSEGRLFAVARSDNSLHIYDVRALSRGPICRFAHHRSDNIGGGGFGVVDARWVEGRDRRRVGILSGGNDGCVRLWEPALAPCDDLQGEIIGMTDFDVGHFSVGDRWKGEMPLIIGDSGGCTQTYDLFDGSGMPIPRPLGR
ncbi:WD40-repeat-containing domain protein [Phlebopus sp. FC_14]|nr:WD40-repeat-containing domain protein [Phlebopus sp. FC_14]